MACELACPPHSNYELCGSSCPSSCAEPALPNNCLTPCQDGCQCDPGFVLSGMGCVSPVQCGCSMGSRGPFPKAPETPRALPKGLAEASIAISPPSPLLPPGLPVLDANDPEDKNSPFYYDWHSLQVGGLICAGVLCAMGIIIAMSE
ncbi:hypothetical protein H8959_005722 [Pygathrix nigripes]